MSEPETPASSDEALEKALQSTIDSLRREFEDRLDEARGEMQRLIDEIQEAEARRREAEEAVATQTDGAPPTLEPDRLLQAVAAVDAGATQEEILNALVAGAARFADRSALFLTTDEGLSLWASHGFADAPDTPLELPWKSGRWTALSEGRGAVVLEASDCEAVAEGLAGDHPTSGVAVPLVLRDRIAAALYADRLTEESLQLPALQILAYSAALGIETLPWRERPTTPSLRLANGQDSPGLALWDPEWTADEVGVGGGSPTPVTPPADDAELDASPPDETPEAEVPEDEAPEDEAIEVLPEESLEEVDLASLPDADWAATDAEGEGLPESLDEVGDEEMEGTLAAEGLGLQMEDSPEASAAPEAVPEGAEEGLLDGGDRDEDRTWVPVDELAPGGDDAEPPTPEVSGWEAPGGEEVEPPAQEASSDSSETPPEPDMTFEMPAEEPVDAVMALEEAPAETQPDEPAIEETPVPDLEVERTPTPEAEIPVEEEAEPQVAGEEMKDEGEEVEDEVAETIPAGPPELDARVEVAPPEDLEGPGSAFATPPLAASEDEADLHEDAKRLARLLVSELMLYNESEIARGRREGNVYSRLADEIDRSREVYEDRVDDRVRSATDYFREELVRVLAGGDPGVLGV